MVIIKPDLEFLGIINVLLELLKLFVVFLKICHQRLLGKNQIITSSFNKKK